MRTITVKPGCMARYDDTSPFLLESGAFELEFNMALTNSNDFFVYTINGATNSLPIIDQRVSIEHLEAGELRAEIKRYLRGELIERIHVEPLILKSVDADLSATPALVELQAKVDQAVQNLNAQAKMYNNAVAAYNAAVERINNIEERLSALEKNYDPTII